MINLFTIVSPPRSGTGWYSRLFTTSRSICFHQLTAILRPYPTNVAVEEWLEVQAGAHDFEQHQRRRLLQGYPEYFNRLWEQELLGYQSAGNSDCFAVYAAPGLFLLWPDMKFLGSVRNGINVVQSLNTPPDAPRNDWDMSSRDLAEFANACRYWAGQIQSYYRTLDWLTSRNALVRHTRLEDMTSDGQEMRRVWEWLNLGPWQEYAERNLGMMTRPCNARTNRSRALSADEVWQGWSTQQRRTFREICGPGMTRLNYAIPPV